MPNQNCLSLDYPDKGLLLMITFGNEERINANNNDVLDR